MLFFLAAPAFAACPANVEALQAMLDSVEEVWQSDPASINELVVQLDQTVACLAELIPPEDAATLHLAHALEARVRRDEVAQQRALLGVAAIKHGPLDPDIAPAQTSLSRLYLSLQRSPPPLRTTTLSSGDWYIDGSLGDEIPLDRNAVLQTQQSGSWTSWYLNGSGHLPSTVDVIAQELAPTPSPPEEGNSAQSGRRALRIAMISSGAGIGLLALNRVAYVQADGVDGNSAEYQRWRTVGNAAYAGASVSGLMAVGFGVGAVVSW